MENEEQLQEDVKLPQEEAVSENILPESPTKKHISFVLESVEKLKGFLPQSGASTDRL